MGVNLIDKDVRINRETNGKFSKHTPVSRIVVPVSSLRTVNSGVSKLSCVKSASVVLFPMLNINLDLVILRNKPLGFLFIVILLTPSQSS